MSSPAGWYDDGSGRQRWWDGAQWTASYAPVQGGGSSVSVDPQAPAQGVAGVPGSVGPKLSSTLGFAGLGLAVLGTILACIPTVVTVPIGLVVLLAAFVVSLIAVFKKNTTKWPSIVGIVLSIVGGVIGVIVLTVVLLVNLAAAVGPGQPSDAPTPIVSEQPSDGPTSDTQDRPSPEAIGEGLRTLLHNDGVAIYDDVPGFFPCVGQFLYDSEMSDEALQNTAAGIDVTGAERDLAIEVGKDSILACDTP